MDATVAFLLVAIMVGAVIFVAASLDRSSIHKSDDNAHGSLESILDPGEQLIAFTKANMKSPSTVAVLLADWLGALISMAGNVELYVGLTNRRLVLTPVKAGSNSRSAQYIPREDIQGIDVGGAYSGTSLTLHTRNGDITVYLSGRRSLRQASALKMALAGQQQNQSTYIQSVNHQWSHEWRPIQPVVLVPTIDRKTALKKMHTNRISMMLIGGLICGLGVWATIRSGSQTLYWGAILAGGVTFFSGLASCIKARKEMRQSSDM